MSFALADLFECVVDHVGERTALVAGSRRLTYAELDTAATEAAHGFADLGLGHDDHIGLYLHNAVEHVVAMLAAYKLRAVPVNVNDRYVATELSYLAADADLAALVHHRSLATEVAAARTRPGVVIEVDDETGLGLPGGSPQRDFAPRSGDDRYLLYTGGTTGMPKGVVWRQEDIFFAAMGGGNPGGAPISDPTEIGPAVVANRAQRITPFLTPGNPGPERFVALPLGPLCHASGQWGALGTLLGGGTLVLYTGRHMDMARVLELVEAERVCMLTLVGDASARPLLAELAGGSRRDTSSLLLVGSGGSILSGDVKDELMQRLPTVLAVLEAIGSSESPAQAVSVVTRATAARSASLTFAPKDDTIVVDEALHPLPRGSGAVGRLATKGRVPLGYYNDPERSARTIVEIEGARWVLPGDMATIDADGTIHLLGRGSLCINTAGEKVYPEEVEAVLKRHPGVGDVLVVGIADEVWGQRVVAVVQPSDDGAPPTLESLQHHARGQLAGYKIPRTLTIVPTLRRTAAGKGDYAWATEQARSDPGGRDLLADSGS
jgi:acyl-CoA synthetase (AMP-forming)/AMP-acid ligase II